MLLSRFGLFYIKKAPQGVLKQWFKLVLKSLRARRASMNGDSR